MAELTTPLTARLTLPLAPSVNAVLGLGTSGGSAPLPSMKRLTPINANNFQIVQPAGNGKFYCFQIMRNQGSNDAGTAHEPWRLGAIAIVDSLDSLYTSGQSGWKFVAVSTGAKDYARNRGAPVNSFGGSVHGGETILSLSEVITADGVDITAAVTGGVAIDARDFVFARNTRITWTADGSTADVGFSMRFKDDMAIDMAIAHSSLAVMGAAALPSLDYLTLDFADSRYNRLITDDGTTNMGPAEANFDINTARRSARLMDPVSGDYADFTFTTSASPSRFHCWFMPANDYSKLYVSSAGGVLAPISLTKKMKYFAAPIPVAPAVLPFTDTFAGAALGSHWKRVQGTGSADSVSGGQFNMGWDGVAQTSYVTPIHREPGTYRVEVDYINTGALGTSGQVTIARADTVQAPAPQIVAAKSLNSAAGGAGATDVTDLTIVAGQTPWLRLGGPPLSGRGIAIREIRISKL